MTGGEIVLQTLAANGVDVCFMNPGTSEMHFVTALDRVPAFRGVLCLFEGVASGAADGYARMAGKPAATLLHLGPGLANGLANFHNARKARTPVVSIVGEHSRGHLQYDAPLSADIAAFARAVSCEVRTAMEPAQLGQAVADTIAAAWGPPGQVAMAIIPADLSWNPGEGGVPLMKPPVRGAVAPDTIAATARLLLEGGNRAALIMGGLTGSERTINAAGRIAAGTGARIFLDRNTPRIAIGRGRYMAARVPYFPEAAIDALSGLDRAILVETQAPVSFFGYPATPSYLLPESCAVSTLATRAEDGVAALEALAAACGAPFVPAAAPPPAPQNGPLTLDAIGAIIAELLPENAIVSDEMVASGPDVLKHLVHAAPHDQMPVTGGSIGQGLPVALGAAIACPDRKVVALEADGSAMYTLQALWTIARENLDVTVVIFANRRYRILDIEMKRTEAGSVGPRASRMIDLANPALDFVKLAEGLGVDATRAATAEEFRAQFSLAMKTRGPRLIEALIP